MKTQAQQLCNGKIAATLVMLAVVVVSGAASTGARAEADGPDYFRVESVASDDILNLRSGPGTQHEIIGEIPSAADGLRNLGCEGGLSFAEWQTASAEEREAAQRRRWCRIEYRGIQGWVAARYLAEGAAPTGAVEKAGFTWRLFSSIAGPVVGEAWIRFEADGGVTGSTGCNNFRGVAALGPGTISFSQPFSATKMFCPDSGKMMQEDAIFAALAAATHYDIDLVTGRLTIEGRTGADLLIYTASE